MKRLCTKKKTINLYTMSDLARALGLAPKTLWQQVRLYKFVPEPTYRCLNRMYYTEEAFNKLAKRDAN